MGLLATVGATRVEAKDLAQKIIDAQEAEPGVVCRQPVSSA
ncbi:hypothetical protein [Actinophytocola sp. NPDC049390]